MKLSSKRFSIFICVAYVLFLGLLFSINFIGSKELMKTNNTNFIELGRERKGDYLSKYIDNYDSFIIGGSKSCSIYPETLKKLTGDSYYNFFNLNGCFEDYEQFISYIIKNKTKLPKEFILHLSSHEVDRYSNYDNLPSVMINNVFKRFYVKVKVYSDFYLNFENLKLSLKRNKGIPDKSESSVIDGNIDIAEQTSYLGNINNYENYEKIVLSYWEPYTKALDDLFNKEAIDPACEKNIESLLRIKKMCSDNDIKLTIVIGPTFITELFKYHSEKYLDYLRQIADIQDFWNFSGINYVSMNGENFFNGGHYVWTIGNEMLDIIYSDKNNKDDPQIGDYNQFGQLITSENVDTYIQNQYEIWKKLKSEYETNGKLNIKTPDFNKSR